MIFIGLISVALLAGGAAAAYFVFLAPESDVKKGNKVVFKPNTNPKPKKPRDEFIWPFYGYTKERTRYLPSKLEPPFKPIWRKTGQVLLEFSPVLAKGVLYLARNNGAIWALRTGNGDILWKKKVGELNAASPAYSEGRLFIGMLSRQVVALDARSGRTLWSWTAPSRIESSPVVVGNSVYMGSESGTLYALNARTGTIRWKFQVGAALKAAPAYADGKLYIGAYNGSMYAVKAKNGKLVWSTHTAGRSLGRSGNFYSSPAVGFGRVYAGNTDGKVYSFSTSDGQIAWSHGTGSYVYASPAVADVPGTKPSVYIGSYDGNFYALDARTGGVRWTHAAGGRISGAATVVGDVVYYANLPARRTDGLDVKTGKRVFKFKTGGFNPVISDGKRLYITGYSSLWGLIPRVR